LNKKKKRKRIQKQANSKSIRLEDILLHLYAYWKIASAEARYIFESTYRQTDEIRLRGALKSKA